MDCSNQQNLKKLKEVISLSVYKRNILVIIDKIFRLKKFFESFGYPGLVFIIAFVIFIKSIYQSCIPSWSFLKSAFSHLYGINIWKLGISMVCIKQMVWEPMKYRKIFLIYVTGPN